MNERIEPDLMAFLADGQEGIGAVRRIEGDTIIVYVENAGEFEVPNSRLWACTPRRLCLTLDVLIAACSQRSIISTTPRILTSRIEAFWAQRKPALMPLVAFAVAEACRRCC